MQTQLTCCVQKATNCVCFVSYVILVNRIRSSSVASSSHTHHTHTHAHMHTQRWLTLISTINLFQNTYQFRIFSFRQHFSTRPSYLLWYVNRSFFDYRFVNLPRIGSKLLRSRNTHRIIIIFTILLSFFVYTFHTLSILMIRSFHENSTAEHKNVHLQLVVCYNWIKAVKKNNNEQKM